MRRPSPIAPPEVAVREAPDHLVVRVGPERFALPLAGIDEAVEEPTVLTVPGLDAGCVGVLGWRGRRVPLHRPHQVTGVRLARPGVGAALVIAAFGRPFALAVDEVLDAVYLAEDDVRPLPGLADPHGVLRGVARDADGLIAVLVPSAVAAQLVPAGEDATGEDATGEDTAGEAAARERAASEEAA